MNSRMYRLRRALVTTTAIALAAMTLFMLSSASADPPASPPPPMVISSIPLNVVAPSTPQVMIALTNSMSMGSSDDIIDDANTNLSIPAGTTHARVPSSAIMTWSGGDHDWTTATPSTSPANYRVPDGFIAPVTGDAAGSRTPYVAPLANTGAARQADNSASRLNIAKQSIAQVIQEYGTQVEFGLMTYRVTDTTRYHSWAYYMSEPGGFTAADFSNSYQVPIYAPGASLPSMLTNRWVNNPCFGTLNADCTTIANALANQTGISMGSYRYMHVAARSDDPPVNDVVLAPYNGNNTFLLGGTLTPDSPYTGFTLADYNCGSNCRGSRTPIVINYSEVAPTQGGDGTYNLWPTNSGYVPHSSQVLVSSRGALWSGNPAANSADVLVPISAAAGASSAEQQAYMQLFARYLTPENNVQSTDTDPVPGVTPAISSYNYYQHAIQASALQSPIAGLLATALKPSSWPATVTPNPNNCPTPRYVILITDGLPTSDLNGNHWPPPGSAAAQGYGASVAFNKDGALNTAGTDNQAMIDAIDQITALNAAGIKTFVVGLGPGVNPALNPTAAKVLTALAIAGGTTNYFPATSPAAVVAQLNTILNSIHHLNVASVAGAVNSTGLNAGTTLYQASYTDYSMPYEDWTGDVRALPVGSDGTVSTTANWSAQCQLDVAATTGTCEPGGALGTGTGWQSRRIATWNPSGGAAGTGAGVPFEWPVSVGINTLSAAQKAALTTGSDDTLGPARLAHLRGDTSTAMAHGGALRNRSHILGDIVDSGPLYIAAPLGPYGGMPGYNRFVSDHQSRTPMLYAGANDGMLHAFEAATGKEDFAFIPNGVFANLIKLTDPNYNDNHQFYVDAAPSAGDVRFANGVWHTLLAGGLNGGGRSIYALDVTDPTAVKSETDLAGKVLWEFTDPHLGLSYSQPTFALSTDTASVNANPSGFLLFFGSGYNNSDQNPYLYALNPENGRLVSKDISRGGTPLGAINLCAAVSPDPCNHSQANGLSGVVAINDAGVMGSPATTVYAGDLQGHLWKVDIRAPNPADWSVTRLFSATDAGGTAQPITGTPAVSLNPQYPGVAGPVVYFGTGQYLGSPDIATTHTQSFYAVLDNGVNGGLTRGNLVQQSLSAASETINGNHITVRTVTSHAVDWSARQGWFLDLPLAGERVISNPRLYSGQVIFTTYAPSPLAAENCAVDGESFLMVLNYQNGGAFAKPQIDLKGDGKITGAAEQNGQDPVGFSLGKVYAPAPTLLSASLGEVHAVLEVSLSQPTASNGGNVQKLPTAGGLRYKVTWTQLQ
ncbi:MAG: pilus assembly protein [Gammaproteobacteria bacterium]